MFQRTIWIALAALLGAAPAAHGAELYLSGDLGISWTSIDGLGTNDIVGITNSGSSEDATPVYGGALGVVFPLNAALPWRWNMPGFGVPYWPGRELRFEGGETRFPEWEVRTEVEHLRGRDAELDTTSFNPLEPYRSDVENWTLMGKLRLDVPVRTPVRALLGRTPFLEPLSIYGGAGAGYAVTDMAVSTAVLFGSDDTEEFAWQALAGVGYQLNDRVKLSLGWRYLDLGQVKTQLFDTAFINRGRYRIDLEAHEFNASLSVWFWRLPPFLGEE
jgi:hypothetical protein